MEWPPPTQEATGLSSEQGLLENELKLAQRTERAREGQLEVFDGLQQRVAAITRGRWLSATQGHAKNIQAPAQSLNEVINRLQRC